MTKRFVLIAYALMICVVVPASAGTSFFGPSGLPVMPTTETLGQGQFQLFANYIDRGEYSESPVGLNVGLGFGMEVGVASIHETGDFGGTTAIVNAKWTVLRETLVRPAVAVGAINATGNDEFTGTLIITKEAGKAAPYFVLSKKLALPGTDLAISGSAGYVGGNLNGLMLGASANLSSKLEVMADYIDNYSELSLGARYQATDALSVNVNMIDGDLALGASYGFGLK